MNVLVIGGREFLGRHIVDSLLAAKHRVTLFNRAQTNPELFSNLETIIGDRERDLNKLKDRKWDVVIDTCGFHPENLALSAKSLTGNCDHYIFISSCSVYEQYPESRVLNEGAQIVALDIDKGNLQPKGKDYGACKYLSERAIDDNFEGHITHLRPGLIVGPYDTTARFTYWVKRLAKGGVTLAPSSPQVGTQVIDARDLADWCVHLAENQIVGTFNATGERKPLGEILSKINETLGRKATLKWVPEEFLRAHDVSCWTELPLWVFDEIDIFVSWDSSKAVENGLIYRPIEQTTLDTFNWLKEVDFDSLKSSPMRLERERELLERFEKRSLLGKTR